MADVPRAEHLLQDIAWLKSLATRLANDHDDADDLTQEALIAAWQRQPDTTRPIRGWLTKVVRDVARMKHRSDRRRTTRDSLVDDAQASAGPDELLAQMRLQRRLVDLVMELDEPYRSTIIARFVEGRTSASIAKSLGIPGGTVRKRLHEALSRLRAGLDADTGDRKRWAPAVLAFAKGGIQVAKPTKLVFVILAALLLTTVAIVVSMRGSGTPTTQTTASSHTPSSQTSSGETPSVDLASTAAASDGPVPRPPVTGHRASMLAAIATARDAREHRTGAAPPPPPRKPGARTASPGDSTTTTLDITDKTGDTSDWEKRALGTLNDLLGQCYDLGRAEDAKLAGSITIRFTLVGEPGVGGLLERVEIVDEDTTISQQTLRDCLGQQLYALELDPPPDGVTVERELTLKFP